jgi:hypothetical protein
MVKIVLCLCCLTAGPYDRQVADQVARLSAEASADRAGAAEALGFLRASAAENALVECLDDRSVDVRRQAAMALAWCGSRRAVLPLLESLGDPDWMVRQAAWVSLTNLTGMEHPFNSVAAPEQRDAEAARWRNWWSSVPADRPPKDVLQLLRDAVSTPPGGTVATSSTYRGPPNILLDGRVGPAYWQTKDVPFPQWCVVDLGDEKDIASVVVHQYGPDFVMTDYELAVSRDGKQFDVIKREKGATPVRLVVQFPPRKARYARITSFGSRNPRYPTTFFEVEVAGPNALATIEVGPISWRQERGVRALGALGGQGATRTILDVIGPSPDTSPRQRPMVRAAIRSLGQLKDEAGFGVLVALLDNPFWAR